MTENIRIPASVANAKMEPLKGPNTGGMPYRETLHIYVDEAALKAMFGADGFESPAAHLPRSRQAYRAAEAPSTPWVEYRNDGKTPDGWDHHVFTIPVGYAQNGGLEMERNPPGVCPYLEVNTPNGRMNLWLTSWGEELKPNGQTR